MNITEIKNKLKEKGITREQLGSKLGVKKRTVDAWLSCGMKIPETKMILIEQILETSDTSAVEIPLGIDSVRVITVRMTKEEFQLCCVAAEQQNKGLEEWARETLLTKTTAILSTEKEEMDSA